MVMDDFHSVLASKVVESYKHCKNEEYGVGVCLCRGIFYSYKSKSSSSRRKDKTVSFPNFISIKTHSKYITINLLINA